MLSSHGSVVPPISSSRGKGRVSHLDISIDLQGTRVELEKHLREMQSEATRTVSTLMLRESASQAYEGVAAAAVRMPHRPCPSSRW